MAATERWNRAGLVEARRVLDAAGVTAAIEKLAASIAEHTLDPSRLVLVGIRTGGVHLAARLGRLLGARFGRELLVGAMDITLYRDDLFAGLPRPEVGATVMPDVLDGRTVVLVDDVLFTGRTVGAALRELYDLGRPARVELAALVDRGHRELPIRADHVGVTVDTTRAQLVRVLLAETGDSDGVVLLEKPAGPR